MKIEHQHFVTENMPIGYRESLKRQVERELADALFREVGKEPIVVRLIEKQLSATNFRGEQETLVRNTLEIRPVHKMEVYQLDEATTIREVRTLPPPKKRTWIQWFHEVIAPEVQYREK